MASGFITLCGNVSTRLFSVSTRLFSVSTRLFSVSTRLFNVSTRLFNVLYVVQTTSAKFGMHAGNMEFNTRNEQWTSIRTVTSRLHLRTCLYVICNKYTLTITKKILGMQFTT